MSDGKGRFIKHKNEEYKISFLLKSITTIDYWIFIFVIFLPWIIIGSRFHLIS